MCGLSQGEVVMKVCLLNEQAERREGLKTLLRQINRHASFYDARDWRQAQRVLQHACPDMLVIDWQDGMSVQDIFDLRRHYPNLPIAALVDDASPTRVKSLVDAGVLGVVPRHLNPRLIVRAFEIVLLGGHYVPPSGLNLHTPTVVPINAYGDSSLNRAACRRQSASSGLLSPRQEQILRLVHMGATNKSIARALGISEGTVKIHLGAIFEKLGATNRAAAVAIYNGWQTGALEVLRDATQQARQPVYGEAGPTPLRAATREHRRRDAANGRDQAILQAAEPDGVPYKVVPRKRR
ncbi:response regulator transcription factor [Mycetohabitans endofungorum]|nr:response regulator transcription factor [Mycetohabitans sp. B3]MCG1019047.1 response regulator transcription factor [Mycetohabitans sp. B4]